MSKSTKAVMKFYEAMATGNPSAVAATLRGDFSYEAPPMLPWGGLTGGRDAVLARVLPQLAAAMDTASLTVETVYGEAEHVFVSTTARTADGQPVRLGEDWTLKDDLPASVRVFWFDPRPGVPPTYNATT